MRFNLNYANVISEKTLENSYTKTLTYLHAVLKNTLGPFGNNTIIEDKYLDHRITKDGFTVYNNILFYKKIPKIVSIICKKISGALNESSGDGTTSAMIITKELLPLKKLIKKYKISPKIVSGLIDILVKSISAGISLEAVNIMHKDNNREYVLDKDTRLNIIRNLAAISCNNDYELGNTIASLFTSLTDPTTGFVHVEISDTEKTYYDVERGFEIYRGMVLGEMCTEADNATAIHENPLFLCVEGHLMSDDLQTIIDYVDIAIAQGRALCVLAGGYSRQLQTDVRKVMLSHKEKHGETLKLLFTTVDTESELGTEAFYDICMNVGAISMKVEKDRSLVSPAIDPEVIKNLGSAKKVLATGRITRIIGGTRNTKLINLRVDELKKRIEFLQTNLTVDNADEIYILRKRIAVLNNDMVTLCVGGGSYEEKNNRKDLIVDAVQSVRSALEFGIVRGGNLAAARAITMLLQPLYFRRECMLAANTLNLKYGISNPKLIEALVRDIFNILLKAYTNTYIVILNNKYNNIFKSTAIAKKCIKDNTIFNLITEQYEVNDIANYKNCKVINSVETDLKIINTATSIVNLLITSNQFIRTPEIDKVRKEIY